MLIINQKEDKKFSTVNDVVVVNLLTCTVSEWEIIKFCVESKENW